MARQHFAFLWASLVVFCMGGIKPARAQAICDPVWKQFGSDVTQLVLSPDGKSIATAGDQGINLWDSKTGKHIRLIIKGRVSSKIAFTPDSMALYFWGTGPRKPGSLESTLGIRIFHVKDGKQRSWLKMPCKPGGVVDIPAFDKKTLIVSGEDDVVTFYDIDTGKKVGKIAGDHRPIWLAVSPDRKWLLTADFTFKVNIAKLRLWDLKKKKLAHELYDHTEQVAGLCFSPDSKFCASATDDGRLFVFDCHKGKELARTPTLMRRTAMPLTFTPDGKTLIAGGYGPGQGVAFWDWKTSKAIRGGIPRDAQDREAARVKNVAGLYSLFVTPDGKRLYTLGRPHPTPDKFKTRIQIWDLDRVYDPKLPKGKVEPSPEPRP